MAKKTLNATQLQRTDSLENWVSKNPVLAIGEIGICTSNGATFMKVGDGATHWNDLPMTSGLAGDVYSWAKASTKPTYNYSEIIDAPNLVEFTDAEITELYSSIIVELAEDVKV